MGVIQLFGGREVQIDEIDREYLSRFRWRFLKVGYAATHLPGGRTVYMHRLILGEQPGVVDHINGDGLDNRRANLRLVDQSINTFNRHRPINTASGVVGVRFYAPRGKWTARIGVRYRNVLLGYFETKEEAIAARKSAELRFFGEPCPANIA